MTTLYHVATDYDGGDLNSLYNQYGNDAYDMFAERWPESDNLGQYHAHYVHLHDNMQDAQGFAATYGGEILIIDATDLDVKIDNLEYRHPIVEGCIPSQYIRRA